MYLQRAFILAHQAIGGGDMDIDLGLIAADLVVPCGPW